MIAKMLIEKDPLHECPYLQECGMPQYSNPSSFFCTVIHCVHSTSALPACFIYDTHKHIHATTTQTHYKYILLPVLHKLRTAHSRSSCPPGCWHHCSWSLCVPHCKCLLQIGLSSLSIEQCAYCSDLFCSHSSLPGKP